MIVKSLCGFVVKVGEVVVNSRAMKPASVSLSIFKAEYFAMSVAAQDVF